MSCHLNQYIFHKIKWSKRQQKSDWLQNVSQHKECCTTVAGIGLCQVLVSWLNNADFLSEQDQTLVHSEITLRLPALQTWGWDRRVLDRHGAARASSHCLAWEQSSSALLWQSDQQHKPNPHKARPLMQVSWERNSFLFFSIRKKYLRLIWNCTRCLHFWCKDLSFSLGVGGKFLPLASVLRQDWLDYPSHLGIQRKIIVTVAARNGEKSNIKTQFPESDACTWVPLPATHHLHGPRQFI